MIFSDLIVCTRVNYRWIMIIFLFTACGMISGADASDAHQSLKKTAISIEYLSPTEDDRDIETFNVDFNYLLSTFDKLHLSIYFGITGTYATGSITQLEGDINAGTLKEVSYDNSAFGIGPGILLGFYIIKLNRISLHINGSGNFILYSERFPAGGDYYNFMWRGGPMIAYEVGRAKSIGVGYQLSHVSNGQGVLSENPSYDAHGIALRLTGLF
jgi:hypothetical protein